MLNVQNQLSIVLVLCEHHYNVEGMPDICIGDLQSRQNSKYGTFFRESPQEIVLERISNHKWCRTFSESIASNASLAVCL